MKNKIFYSSFVLISLLVILSACGPSKELKSQQEQTGLPAHLTIHGGSVGGVWSIFTEGISEAVRREYPGTFISSMPGTVAGNAVLVDRDKTDFAIVESLTAKFASEGKTPFKEKYEGIRAIAAIIPENTFQMVAPKKVAFDSIQDIADDSIGVRYSAGEKGGLGDLISIALFAAYGLSYNTFEANGGDVNFLSGGKTFELMQDARIDSLGKMVPIPAGDIIEASASIDMKLIELGQKGVDYLVELYDVSPYIIKAGSYDFQMEDYLTINTPTILITHESMSDEAVYHITKAIYSQLDYLKNVHNGFKSVNDKTIIDVGGVRLHPGAKKFFTEKGLLNSKK